MAEKKTTQSKNVSEGKGFSAKGITTMEGCSPGEPVKGDTHGKGQGSQTGPVDSTKA
jgi:hypothetical protein